MSPASVKRYSCNLFFIPQYCCIIISTFLFRPISEVSGFRRNHSRKASVFSIFNHQFFLKNNSFFYHFTRNFTREYFLCSQRSKRRRWYSFQIVKLTWVVANQPRHPIFKFSKQKGEIDPNGTITIRFSCVPVNSGPQQHTILVRNLINMLQVSPELVW